MMVMHQAPTDGGNYEGVAHFHVEFYPLNRTREKLKYLAGSETGAGAFIVDVMPEAMAAQLHAALEHARNIAPAEQQAESGQNDTHPTK
jgi:UDPglucose--hexose-1-phosphate uridylyltransferase